MHLVIPFAAPLSEPGRAALGALELPTLEGLLARLAPAERDEGDEYQLSPPHERALARAWGWHGADGRLPFAARAAEADGIEPLDLAWGLMSPVHWQVGAEHLYMGDPDALGLDAAESRAFFDAVRPLFESEGYACAWGEPTRWYVAHGSLADLPTASLDRVIGRNVDPWLGETASPVGRRVRRLQSEAQLVYHAHPANEAREARGEPVVNSFWLSGCGRAQPIDAAAEPNVDRGLRTPLLAGDWAAWAEAWQRLDADAIAQAARAAATLTLCGERSAARFEARPQGLLQRLRRRWQATEAHAVLEGL